jgi:hypothetical protein
LVFVIAISAWTVFSYAFFKKTSPLIYIIVLPLTFLLMLNRASFGTDTEGYLNFYIGKSDVNNVEWVFGSLLNFVNYFDLSINFLFFLLFAISIISKYFLSKKFGINFGLFFGLYVIYLIYSKDFGLIRVAAAAPIFILAISNFTIDRKYITSLILLVIAFGLHWASLVLYLIFLAYNFLLKIVDNSLVRKKYRLLISMIIFIVFNVMLNQLLFEGANVLPDMISGKINSYKIDYQYLYDRKDFVYISIFKQLLIFFILSKLSEKIISEKFIFIKKIYSLFVVLNIISILLDGDLSYSRLASYIDIIEVLFVAFLIKYLNLSRRLGVAFVVLFNGGGRFFVYMMKFGYAYGI